MLLLSIASFRSIAAKKCTICDFLLSSTVYSALCSGDLSTLSITSYFLRESADRKEAKILCKISKQLMRKSRSGGSFYV